MNDSKLAFPDRSNEEWRYSCQRLRSVVTNSNPSNQDYNGDVEPVLQLGNTDALVVFANGTLNSISDPEQKIDVSIEDCCSFVDNNFLDEFNRQYTSKQYVLRIVGNSSVNILYASNSDIVNRINIIIEDNVQASIAEFFMAEQEDILQSHSVALRIADNAKLDFYSNHNTSNDNLLQYVINLYKNVEVNFYSLVAGKKFDKHNVIVNFCSSQSECQINTCYLARHDKQFIDNYAEMNHLSSNNKSKQNYFGIVDGGATASFLGKIFVDKNCPESLVSQINRVKLLSKKAVAYSKPSFDVLNDNVQCNHGSAIGFIDDNALLYMRARGIDKVTATNLLVKYFAYEVFNPITSSDVRDVFYNEIKKVVG